MILHDDGLGVAQLFRQGGPLCGSDDQVGLLVEIRQGLCEQHPLVVDRPQNLFRGGKGRRIQGVGVHDAVDILPGPVDFNMDREFPVEVPPAVDLPVVEIDGHKIVRMDLAQTQAFPFDDHPIRIVRRPDAHMAEVHVVMSLGPQYPAGQRQFLLCLRHCRLRGLVRTLIPHPRTILSGERSRRSKRVRGSPSVFPLSVIFEIPSADLFRRRRIRPAEKISMANWRTGP